MSLPKDPSDVPMPPVSPTAGAKTAQICGRCGEPHAIFACPYVKAINFSDAGDIVRVEFLTPADYGPAPKKEADVDVPDYPKARRLG